jgi:ribosomal protein S18 acetylase RimI-like enzyme
MKDISIATRADVDALGELKGRCFSNKLGRGCFARSMATAIERAQAAYRLYPDDKLATCGVVRDEGKIVGMIQLQLAGQPGDPLIPGIMQHDPWPNEVYIETVAVAEEARGKGIGTDLLVWAAEFAAFKGARALTLDYVGKNPSAQLFARNGFQVVTNRDSVDVCCTGCFVFLFLGCRYSSFTIMKKDIAKKAAE